jgi:N-acetylneuraminic acid mutarotase
MKSPATGKWTKRSSMKQGAVFAGTALGSDGRIYVISGNTEYDGGLTAAVHVYDPARDMWSEAAPIPTPRTSAGAAIGPDGRIYVVGGAANHVRQMDVVEAYDIKKDSWVRLRPLSMPRDAAQAVAAKGVDGRVRIYALGGRDRSKPGNGLNTVEAYDPDKDTWTAMAPMPVHVHGHAATLGPDGRIYVLGGTNDHVFFTDMLQIYDPVKDTWILGTPMPYGQECAMATFTSGPNGEILIFAGWDTHKRPVNRAVAYNPRTQKWRSLPKVPAARAAGGVVTVEDKDGCAHVYVLGGTGEDGSGKIHPRVPIETSVEEYSFRPLALNTMRKP